MFFNSTEEYPNIDIVSSDLFLFFLKRYDLNILYESGLKLFEKYKTYIKIKYINLYKNKI